MSTLQNKRVLLGITGGIAAYKAAELTRLLTRQGAAVRVVMTEGAQAFITPLTLQAVSGQPVHTDLLDPQAEAGMGHIELARWADVIVVAPASANFLARLAQGVSNDLLSTLCLASRAPLAVAPAMNQAMWANAATQANLCTLRERGVQIWGPASGEQACGDVGPGRMLEPAELAEQAAGLFSSTVLSGKTVVITAGPTREALDPVRYLSNHSSGKMGYALAQAAVEAGARVILISGPVNQPVPERVEVVAVTSAEQMLTASLDCMGAMDIFIAAAAVADYRPANPQAHKIKKQREETMVLELVKNPDIVAAVAAHRQHPFTVGFAAETERLDEHARGKLERKQLDMIIANDVSDKRIGFNSDHNAVSVLSQNTVQVLPEQHKHQLARELIKLIAAEYSLKIS